VSANAMDKNWRRYVLNWFLTINSVVPLNE
jgi:hypothetical protein